MFLRVVGGGGDVTTSSSPVDMGVFAFWVFFVCIFRLDEKSVSTKVVTLRLKEVGGEVFGTVTVVPTERRAKSRKRDAP